jgi:hypothetical protein
VRAGLVFEVADRQLDRGVVAVIDVGHERGKRAVGREPRTSASVPQEIGGSPFGLRLQAALVMLTAAYRVSRRGLRRSLVICSA